MLRTVSQFKLLASSPSVSAQTRGLAWPADKPEWVNKKKWKNRAPPRFSQDGHYKYTFHCPAKPAHTAPHCGNYSNTQADTKTETKADTAYRLVIDNKDVIKQKNYKLKEETIYPPAIRGLNNIDSSFHNPFLDISFTKHIAKGNPERARFSLDKGLEIVKLMQLKQLQSDPDSETSAPAVVNKAMLNVQPAVLIQFKCISLAGVWKPCPVPVDDTRAIYQAMKQVRLASQPHKQNSVAVGRKLGKVWLESYNKKGKVIAELQENYRLAHQHRHLYRQFGPMAIKIKKSANNRFPHHKRPTKILPLPHDEYSRLPGNAFTTEVGEELDEEDRKR